jgi:alkanesulfonate monooxygenase SsuD/methylene tetrahydromethanopterin reductase-like flavin-dependent oxidoreductase (luciferase family)
VKGDDMARFGVAVPQAPSDATELARFGAAADRARLDVWVGDLRRSPTIEPVAALAYLAASTADVRIGAAVLLPVVRTPLVLAAQLAAVDHLSGGRLDVGVGLGTNLEEYQAFGIGRGGRADRFEEAVALLDAAWSPDEHGRFWFDGRHWRADGILAAAPVQRPRPPLWFGGQAPNALARAVRLGDGWLASGAATTAQFRAQHEVISTELDRHARDRSSFRVGKRLFVLVDDDRPRGMAAMRAWCASTYGVPALADRVAIVGGSEACAEAIADVVAAGADTVVVQSPIDPFDHVGWLADDVVGHFEGM